jgi:exonuclease III
MFHFYTTQTDNTDTHAFNATVTKTGSVMVTTPFFPSPENNAQNFSEKGKWPSTYHHWAGFLSEEKKMIMKGGGIKKFKFKFKRARSVAYWSKETRR